MVSCPTPSAIYKDGVNRVGFSCHGACSLITKELYNSKIQFMKPY